MPIKSAVTIKSEEAFYFDRIKKGQSLHRLSTITSLGFFTPPTGVTFDRATAYRDLSAAYALCYRIFLNNGYIEPNFMGTRLRDWELHDHTATFVARADKRVIGVSSLAADIAGKGLPTEWLYPQEMAEVRRFSGVFAEVCNGALEKAYRQSSIPLELFRCMLAGAWQGGINKLIAVINRTHRTFYELCYAVQIGGEKNYAADRYDPVILMYMDCNVLHRYLSSPESDNNTADGFLRRYLLFDNPYLPRAPGWNRRAQAAFRRQRIADRFQDDIRNTLVESVFPEDLPGHGNKRRSARSISRN